MGNKILQNYFNNLSGRYIEQNKATIPLLKKLCKLSRKYINGNVLDIGNGGIISFDFKKAKTITISDVSVELLKSPRVLQGNKLNLLKGKVEIVQASALELPFKDNTFDVVIMFNVLHHLSTKSLELSRKRVRKAFIEAYRVLKSGGVILINDNCPSFLIRLLQDFTYEFWYWIFAGIGKPLPYFLSKRQIEYYLGQAKFCLVSNKRIPWPQKIYLPIFPRLSPPGWLWTIVLRNEFFVFKKKVR